MTGTEPEPSPERAGLRGGTVEQGIDVELVRLAQQGDTDAFGHLVDRNRRAVYRAAYAALGSAADADDVVQDAFITAYRKLHGFRHESSFRTWLLSIAWRKALDRRKSATRWMRLTVTQDPFSAGSPDVLDCIPSVQRSQDERLAAEELHRALKQLIARLPRKLRDPLLLAGSGEYSYEEIARMLGIPVGTLKWRVSEARRVLKQKLAALGYSHE